MTRILIPWLVVFLIAAACQPAPVSPVPTASQNATPSALTTPTITASRTLPPPTATAEPGPRSFTEGFDGLLPNWSFVQVDNGNLAPTPVTAGGLLVFALPARNQWLYALYGSQEYTDVRVDTQYEDRGSGMAVAGVVCRYDLHKGWYELNVYPDQTYVLLYGQWLTAGVARYTTIVRNQSEKIQAGANQIGLDCKGTTLTPFINGVQMRQRVETMYGLTGGKVGLAAASFENAPETIAVDWVKVGEP
jgi:hypothetical protein